MISFWWVMAAFIAGGFGGVLVMALMYMSGGLPKAIGACAGFERDALGVT
jgi:hypothetical protein